MRRTFLIGQGLVGWGWSDSWKGARPHSSPLLVYGTSLSCYIILIAIDLPAGQWLLPPISLISCLPDVREAGEANPVTKITHIHPIT